MPKRHQVIQILAPTNGIRADIPRHELEPRSQEQGQNMSLFYGVNQKDSGTSLYATGVASTLGTPVNGIFEANFPNGAQLEVFTPVNVLKYTQGADTYISDGQTFTGTYTDFWSALMHNDAFIYTNGVDPIQVKASFSATGTNMVSAVNPTTYKAQALVSIRDHLCLYHTIENGTEYYKRVRWSRKGVLTYSAGTTDFASGVAGGIDVQDCQGAIIAAAPLAGNVAVYAEHSIHIQYWVGSDEVFRFEKTIPGIGVPGRRCVASYGNVNWFLSHQNCYEYHGGDDLRPIADEVYPQMFSEINNSAIATSFVEYDEIDNLVMFHIPTHTSSLPDRTWVYYPEDKKWAKLVRNYSAAGRFSRKTGLTIGELVGNIGAQNFTFGEAAARVESRVRLHGDHSGRIVKNDPTVYSIVDSGTQTAQTFIWQTPDLNGIPAKDPVDNDEVQFISTTQRWQRATLELHGAGSGYVSYSTDAGRSFVNFDESPVTLSSTGDTFEFDVEVSSPIFCVQVINSGVNEYCAVKYCKVDFIPGGDR